MLSQGANLIDPEPKEVAQNVDALERLDQGANLVDPEPKDVGQKVDALESQKLFASTMVDAGDVLDQSLTKAEEWDDLPNNIYSIVYFASPRSMSFYFALLVYAFQASIVCLALADVIDPQQVDNPLQVPAGVTDVVRAAQFLALILAAAAQGDMIEALQVLSCGYDKHVLQMNVHASSAKWLLAYVAQFTVGGLLLIVNFCLLVSSSTVLNLFLNFAALWFIQEIDDVAFRLGQLGYLTNGLKETCDYIEDAKAPRHRRGYVVRRLALFLILLALIGGLILVVWKQLRGDYDCKKILVQFGDEFIPALAAFSGVYELDAQTGTKDRRRVYINTLPVLEDKKDRSFFRYCTSHQAWVFGFPITSSSELSLTIDNICQTLPPLRSPETDTFDITSIDSRTWLVANANSFDATVYPVEHLFLACNDCSNGRCQGDCNAETNVCECDSSHFGDNCEFKNACRDLDLDKRTESFSSSYSGVGSPFVGDNAFLTNVIERQKMAMKFTLLVNDHTQEGGEPIKFNNRPVYTSPLNAVMLFNGRRWLVYQNVDINEIYKAFYGISSEDLTYVFDDDSSNLTKDDKESFQWLANGFTDEFLSLYNNFTLELSDETFWESLHKDWLQSYGYGSNDSLLGYPSFVSETLDLGSPKNQAAPQGLSWFTLAPRNGAEGSAGFLGSSPWLPLDTKFICTVCDAVTNPCLNGGRCFDGKCECFQSLLGKSGTLCESDAQSCAGDDAFVCKNGSNCSTTSPDRCECGYSHYGLDCSMEVCSQDILPCFKECSNDGRCVCDSQELGEDYLCCRETNNSTYCDGFYEAYFRLG